MQEEQFMRRALILARRGEGKTKTNPMVGAVVVRNNSIIGEAYHHRPGQAHAEVLALKNLSKNQLQNATLYVTLEPCCHANKQTPPCTEMLIHSGLRSVVIAVTDKNPMVNGRGISVLRKAGIKVRIGLLAQEAEQLNEIFFKNIVTPLPFVTVKLALTLDGKIATASGDSRWITAAKARRYVHGLRGCYDAVLTSSTTVMRDNPELGLHGLKGSEPLRVIIDRKLVTNPTAKVYRNTNVVVATTVLATLEKQKVFEAAGIALKKYSTKFSLALLLKDLRTMGIRSVLVEAGGTLVASLIKAKLVDKYLFFLAPKIVGGDGINGIGDLAIRTIDKAITLQRLCVSRYGDDMLIEAYS